MSETKINMTIDAPEWALKFGFPEWKPVTDIADVPEDASCVESLVYDAVDGEAYQIFTNEDSMFKVKVEEI
jgi:hypothetical protein